MISQKIGPKQVQNKAYFPATFKTIKNENLSGSSPKLLKDENSE